MGKKLRACAALLLCAVLLSGLTALAADRTSFSYTYDSKGTAQAVPVPYASRQVVLGGERFGGTELKDPADLCVVGDEAVYILDSGNGRIVVLDGEYAFVETVTLTEDGRPLEFAEATGIFADEERLYVADKGAQTVYVADHGGRVLGRIGAPPADKVEEGFFYAPTHVLADTDGVVYIISANTYSGALQYGPDGMFLGFFGSDTITPTLKVRLNQLWKRILSDEAAAGLQRNVPVSFAQFDIDEKNFLYTVRGGTGAGSGQVRRVNPSGVNVLLDEAGEIATYGDLDTYFDPKTNQPVTTTFIDVTVDDEGFFTLLDATRNRLFQYDENTNLLFTFGGEGSQLGTFVKPVAVENRGRELLVLDSGLGGLHVFEPTGFGSDVRTAISLYNDGRYEEAGSYWEAVLSRDAYYEMANVGIGKVHERMGEYSAAMKYYKRGRSQEGYSSAFAARRDEWAQAHFLLILLGTAAVLLLLVGRTMYRERHPVDLLSVRLTPKRMPFYCLKHPFDGFGELRRRNSHSVGMAGLLLGAWVLLSVLQTQVTSFHFAKTPAEDFNLLVVLAQTAGAFLLFSLCNWAISTLADGRGRLVEIGCYTAYALIPYMMTQVALMALSNLFSLEEGAFYSIVGAVGLGVTAVYLIIALKEVHEYTVSKTVLTIVGTLLGMYFVILIITIAYSMFIQLIGFLTMLYSELRLR